MIHLLFVPFLIALNAFFVAAEYAVVAARPLHVESLRCRGYRTASKALGRLRRDPASAIGAIQVCITATNLALGWIGEPAMTRVLTWALGPIAAAVPDVVFRPVSVVLSFMVVTLLTVVFSELLPKALTLRYVETAAMLTAAPVVAIGAAVSPLVWLMNSMANLVTLPLGLGRVEKMEEETVNVEELRLLATEAAAGGVLTGYERSLILNTLALNHRRANHIMVPRLQVAYLDLRKSMEENRATIDARMFTRLPLCDGGLDQVVGLVHIKRFLAAQNAQGDISVLQLIADEPVFAPETSTIGQVLALFHEKRTEFVVLVDEYGGVAGILTLQDVVDDLFGVVDESKALLREAQRTDILPGHVAGKRVVRGDLPVHELARLLMRPDWPADATSAATVAGLVQSRLGDIGKKGDEVQIDGIALRVTQSDGRAIRLLEVEPLADAPLT